MVAQDDFDEFALEYDQWFEDHDLEYKLELDAVRKLLPKGGVGIEIGAGSGQFTQPLAIPLGVEPSKAMRRIALSRGINIVAGTAESIPLKGNSIDFALMVTTVCFLESPELALTEVYRVLRAEGFIIVGLIDKESKLGRKYEKKQYKSKFYKNANFHSVVELKEKLENAGFSHIEYVQAIMPDDRDDNYEPEVKQGHGEGSFVVIRAQKHDA